MNLVLLFYFSLISLHVKISILFFLKFVYILSVFLEKNYRLLILYLWHLFILVLCFFFLCIFYFVIFATFADFTLVLKKYKFFLEKKQICCWLMKILCNVISCARNHLLNHDNLSISRCNLLNWELFFIILCWFMFIFLYVNLNY